MLDGIFTEENTFDYNTNNKDNNTKNPNLNCASYLIKPDPPRSKSNFVGLLNQ